MVNLKAASRELFTRDPDERFETLDTLAAYCRSQKEQSLDRWQPPQEISVEPLQSALHVQAGSDGAFALNDWSFSQLCRLAGVQKDTLNRLSLDTASRVFAETLPRGRKPVQILTEGQVVRSIHSTQYARLWNADLIETIRDSAPDFVPPHKGFNGATGLYAGEQDMFCFLIDPAGWVEIGDETFAPGFFAWNSEVGKRSLGVQTFWFQSICSNHIVWDAVEVVEWKRKHTGNVSDGLGTIREIIAGLVEKRDARKDGFSAIVQKAMHSRLGDDAEECLKVLASNGITRQVAKQAIEYAQAHGGFSIWSMVDAITRITGQSKFIGSRTEADARASQLLALAV